jgi:hypothetical protein
LHHGIVIAFLRALKGISGLSVTLGPIEEMTPDFDIPLNCHLIMAGYAGNSFNHATPGKLNQPDE